MKKVYICLYILITGLLCFYLFAPSLEGQTGQKGLEYGITMLFWVYCFFNPYIIKGCLDFDSR